MYTHVSERNIFVWGTYCHIWSAAHVHCLGDGVDELTSDSEIAQFELTITINENIGRFDICGDRRV